MDKQSLSVFGWVVIVLIFIASIIALLPSFGDALSDSLFKSSGNLMNNAEIARPISVNIQDSYYGKASLLRNDYFEKEVVEFNVDEYPGYIYNGAVVTSEDGQILNLNKKQTSFVLGVKNVSIALKFVGTKTSIDVSPKSDNSAMLVIYENNTALLSGVGSLNINNENTNDVKDIDVLYISSNTLSIPKSFFNDFSSLELIIIESSPENMSIPIDSLPSGFDTKNIIYKY